ncbi:MAG: hypothetical protein ACKN89_13870 [Cyanobium sp.]|jgi:hypothetical protein
MFVHYMLSAGMGSEPLQRHQPEGPEWPSGRTLFWHRSTGDGIDTPICGAMGYPVEVRFRINVQPLIITTWLGLVRSSALVAEPRNPNADAPKDSRPLILKAARVEEGVTCGGVT